MKLIPVYNTDVQKVITQLESFRDERLQELFGEWDNMNVWDKRDYKRIYGDVDFFMSKDKLLISLQEELIRIHSVSIPESYIIQKEVL